MVGLFPGADGDGEPVFRGGQGAGGEGGEGAGWVDGFVEIHNGCAVGIDGVYEQKTAAAIGFFGGCGIGIDDGGVVKAVVNV